jgi:hypothetical protein
VQWQSNLEVCVYGVCTDENINTDVGHQYIVSIYPLNSMEALTWYSLSLSLSALFFFILFFFIFIFFFCRPLKFLIN